MSDNENIEPNDIVDLIPLDTKTNELAQEIVNEQNLDKVQDLTHLFNLNQAKKNVLRVIKLNSLLDKVSDQMIERFEKRPGEFSNNDLLNYMQVTQNAIDRAQKQLNLVDESPAISMTQINVNVEEPKLDRDSRAKITEAVSKMLQMAEKLHIDLEDKQDEIVLEPEEVEITDVESDTSMHDNVQDAKLLNEEE